jgi:hypothetical protein
VGAIDTSGLLPGDVVAALRSLSRRLHAALDSARFGDGGTAARDAAAGMPAADGRSAHERLAQVAGLTTETDRAVAELVLHDGGVLRSDRPTDDPARFAGVAALPIDQLLLEVGYALDALIDRLESLAPATWAHTGTTHTGESVPLLDVVRSLVGVIADDLRAIERAMRAAGATD